MTCGNQLLKNLLFFSLISSVCGTFEVNATQTSYQAEENEDITLEFLFTTKADTSPEPIEILCELLADDEPLKVFHLYDGADFLWSQNKQFAGRVQYDKDLLREGRLILNVSRLRTRDSGRYLCTVVTSSGSNTGRCSLNVTAARHLLEPETPSTSQPQPQSRGRYGLYGALGLAVVALLFVCFRIYRQSWLIEKIQSATPNQQDLPEDYEDHSNICTMPEEQELVILTLQEDNSIICTLPKAETSETSSSLIDAVVAAMKKLQNRQEEVDSPVEEKTRLRFVTHLTMKIALPLPPSHP